MKKRFPFKKNILLVNITRLGDMLQATPTIAGLKMENPDAKITVLVEKQFSEVCKFIPNIDEVVSADLSLVVRALAREQDGIIDAYEYITELVEDLRKREFDYCLNMSSSAYTALLLNLIGIKQNGGWNSDDEGYRKIESDWAKLFATSVFHQNRQYNSLNLVDVFRCSADVEQHPNNLVIDVKEESLQFAEKFIEEFEYTNNGPLIAIQAGASQLKRQWNPKYFAELIKNLVHKLNGRIVLIGTKSELPVIEQITSLSGNSNILIAAGKTTIPQLSAILKKSDILITGDTGPMHISVAVGTPVIAMFLASAYGFETGPYGEGNIILQPVIGCSPCNPNKSCSKPDCHETISPELVFKLTEMRLKEDFKTIPDSLYDPKVIIYRSFFDEHNFYNMEPLDKAYTDSFKKYREAYRLLWLDDLAGYEFKNKSKTIQLKQYDEQINGSYNAILKIKDFAEQGELLINTLLNRIQDRRGSPKALEEVNDKLSNLDRDIEIFGFDNGFLGPLVRMFIFAKENLTGNDPEDLASQMNSIYKDLHRRGDKFLNFLKHVN